MVTLARTTNPNVAAAAKAYLDRKLSKAGQSIGVMIRPDQSCYCLTRGDDVPGLAAMAEAFVAGMQAGIVMSAGAAGDDGK